MRNAALTLLAARGLPADHARAVDHYHRFADDIALIAACALFGFSVGNLITLPALIGDDAGIAFAFNAVVSIAVIGLYIAYAIPIYLRWRKGDDFEPGPWTLGKKYKWVNPIAVLWVVLCVIIFSLPTAPISVPWDSTFDIKYMNYAPITVLIVIIAVGLWWLLSAKNHFTGPIRQVRTDDTGRVIDEGEIAGEGPGA